MRVPQLSSRVIRKGEEEKKSPEGLSWKDEGFPERLGDSYSLMGRFSK